MQGGGYYWHTRIGELHRKKKYTQEEKEELDSKFERIFYAMKMRGFNPALSHISVTYLPVMGQSDGTHRMGYLLYERPNVFVPAQILSPISWSGQPVDGISWFSQLGMPSEEIEQLLERYRILYNGMRRHIIVIVDKRVFDNNSTAFMQTIESIGKCIGIKCAHKKCGDLKIPRRYMKFLKNKVEIIIFEVKIECQMLYYEHGKLKSKLADILTDRFYKSIGASVYVAGTITESIALETYMDENYFIEMYEGT